MSLDHITIEGFKSISKVDLELTSVNILIGANGAGKSNFINVFNALNQMLNDNFQHFIAKTGGANAYLHNGEKETQSIKLKLRFKQNSYECEWQPTIDDNFLFARELAFWHGPNFPDDSPYSVPLGTSHKESKLEENSQSNLVCKYVLKALSRWKVYHFHDTSNSAGVKKVGSINDNEYLRPDASNLAAFLFALQQTHKAHFDLIRNTIRLVAPFFQNFKLRPTVSNDEFIKLEWTKHGSDMPYQAHQLSDGTLRFICLTTLLMQPNRPDTIIIDEPELGLHPYAINVLASMIKAAAAAGTQIILSTQSAGILDQFTPNDILVVDLDGSSTNISRLNELEVQRWLEQYSLGQIWQKNIIGGRPSSV